MMALQKAYGGKQPHTAQAAFVAENATLIGDVTLGKNSSVWYGAVLRADSGHIIIGENTNVQDGAVLHTGRYNDIAVGCNVTIGHGAIVHGCTVGSEVLIGMHATILNGAVIGDRAVVGAGALVPEGMVIPAGMLAVGVPAKIRGPVRAELLAANTANAAGYVVCAQAHAVEPMLGDARKTEPAAAPKAAL